VSECDLAARAIVEIYTTDRLFVGVLGGGATQRTTPEPTPGGSKHCCGRGRGNPSYRLAGLNAVPRLHQGFESRSVAAARVLRRAG